MSNGFAIHSNVTMDDIKFISAFLKDFVENKTVINYNTTKHLIEVIDKLDVLITEFNKETQE